MTTSEDVLAEIRRLARSELSLDRELKTTDRLVEDLGLDSVTMTTLAVGLEDHFRVILTGAPPEELSTIGGLATFVAAHADAHAEQRGSK